MKKHPVSLHPIEHRRILQSADASFVCRTLFRFLSEIRVSQACRLLARPDLTVAQAAAEAGFFNLSHFNKQFRSLIRQTPTEYRRRLGII